MAQGNWKGASTGGGLTLGTEQATTSGTVIDFTGIPAGVNEVLASCIGVSTNGSAAFILRIGAAGGIETTGYNSVAGFADLVGGPAASTVGFNLVPSSGGAGLAHSFQIRLVRENGNKWMATSIGHWNSSPVVCHFSSGQKTLSGELDRIRLTTTNGTDVFDAGVMNIAYL